MRAEHFAALDQLDNIKRRDGRKAPNAKDVIKWLDLVTSDSSEQSARIHLQGVNEAYNDWAEVDRFLVQMKLPPKKVQEQKLAKMESEISSKLHIHDSSDINSVASTCSIGVRSKSPSSPRSLYSSTSASLLTSSPCKDDKIGSAAKPGTQYGDGTRRRQGQYVPLSLQAFFNHAVWRMNQKSSSDSCWPCVILTNDPKKSEIASYFNIRAINTGQLGDLLSMKQGNSAIVASLQDENYNETDDLEEEIVLKRTPREKIKATSKANDQGQLEKSSSPYRGRGRGRPRGGLRGVTKGRGAPAFNLAAQTISKPIDPDSFVRTSPNARRGFGGRKKLWEPS